MPSNRLRSLRHERQENDSARGSGSDDGRQSRIHELTELLEHGDRDQLRFQIAEIAGDRNYTRHGVEVGVGDVVIDAGGNYGVSAAHFALQCGASRAYSLEPVPETCRILERNLAGVAACEVRPFGLADTDGPREMTCFTGGDSVMSGVNVDLTRARELLSIAAQNLGLDEASAEAMAEGRMHPHSIDCEFVRLSSFLRSERIGRVDLLKIDVEGSELDVLRGIDPEDWPRIAQISAEVHGEDSLTEMERLLARHSFRVVIRQDPSWRERRSGCSTPPGTRRHRCASENPAPFGRDLLKWQRETLEAGLVEEPVVEVGTAGNAVLMAPTTDDVVS
jgi:FkbM family methyltransferase